MAFQHLAFSKLTPKAVTWAWLLCLCLIPYLTPCQIKITLSKALLIAQQNNPELVSEKYNLNINQSDITTARLRPNPILNNQSLQLTRSSFFPEDTRWYNRANRQVWWQLTRNFQPPLQRKSKIELAEANLDLAQKTYQELERTIYLNVSQKWLDTWYSQKRLGNVEIAKLNADSLLYINKLRFNKEVITETDLLRTQLLASQYQQQYQLIYQNYLSELRSLKLLLCTPDSLQIDTGSLILPQKPLLLDSLLESSAELRTDLKVVESNINAAKANYKYQKALVLPQPELGVIYNPQNSIPYWGFYGTVDLPILNRNQGEIEKAQWIRLQQEKILELLQRNLKTEIQLALDNYNRSRQIVNSYESMLKQSDQILQNIKYAYLRGGTTIIDFLEAQRSWLENREQYYEALYNLHKSYVDLLYQTGTINELVAKE